MNNNLISCFRYASRAKKIRNTLKQNVVNSNSNLPKEVLLKKCNDQASQLEVLKSENEKLREQNRMLESQLLEKETVSRKAGDSFVSECDLDSVRWREKIDSVFANYDTVHGKCLSLQSCEKILVFRIELKEKYQELRKRLPLDNDSSVQQVSFVFIPNILSLHRFKGFF